MIGFLGFLARQFAAFACMLFLFVVVLSNADDGSELLLGFKIAVLIPALALLALENLQVRRTLEHRTYWLEQNDRKPPARWDKRVRRWFLWPLYGMVILGFLLVRKLFTLVGWGTGDTWNLLVLTVMLRGVLSLFAGSWTTWRYWFATLGLSKKWRAPLSMPLVVAAEGVAAMAVSAVAVPHAAWMKLLFYLAIIVAQVSLERQGAGQVELLVTLEGPEDSAWVDTTVQQMGGSTQTVTSSVLFAPSSLRNIRVVRVPTVGALLLAGDLNRPDRVTDIQWNSTLQATHDRSGGYCERQGASFASDPYAGSQLALQQIGLHRLSRERLFSLFWTRSRLGIIDSGVKATHDDLKVIDGDWFVQDPHGTAVAGIAAAVSDNRLGIASPNWYDTVDIVSLAELDASSATDDVIRALTEAMQSDTRTVLMAFGSKWPANPLLQHAVDLAHANDIVLIAAAGNDGTRASSQWPANLDGVVAVTSHNAYGRSAFANRGDVPLSIAAPGEDVCAPTLEGGYRKQTGTSMSAALVAGAVATLRSKCPTASRREVLQHLFTTADATAQEPRLRVDRLLSTCP